MSITTHVFVVEKEKLVKNEKGSDIGSYSWHLYQAPFFCFYLKMSSNALKCSLPQVQGFLQRFESQIWCGYMSSEWVRSYVKEYRVRATCADPIAVHRQQQRLPLNRGGSTGTQDVPDSFAAAFTAGPVSQLILSKDFLAKIKSRVWQILYVVNCPIHFI